MKKKQGFSEFFSSTLLLSFVSLCLLFVVKLISINASRDYITDGLVASNLASAVIDLDEYGTTNKILINDFEKTYNIYLEAIKDNLELDNNNIPKKNFIEKKEVKIIDFTIYNVDGNDIYQITKNENGSINKMKYYNEVGKMKTPDGAVISTTTIYSKIGFYISGFKNESIYATKENSVDITKN